MGMPMLALWAVALLFTVTMVTSQKLFFKSFAEQKPDSTSYTQGNGEAQRKGFGFQKPKQYFTQHRTALQMSLKDYVGPVVCPGNQSACPEGNTCCRTGITGYGCCPLPMAVCCLDNRHCCPVGLKCDVTRRACINGDVAISWYEKQSSVPLYNMQNKKTESGVVCPDGEHQCTDGQTCCKSSAGYSCCPLPEANCCSDEIHCCPKDTTCDLQHSKCLHKLSGEMSNWFEKTPTQEVTSLKVKMADSASETRTVKCDEKHECPTGNTCCKMESEQWGCCPKPLAVCCEDKVHCCPHGMTCDKSTSQCHNGQTSIPWSTKIKATETKMDSSQISVIHFSAVKNVQCDGTHECPSGNTCCKLSSGQWGCCPIPNAVCCSDDVHCCPESTTCDVSSGKCNRGNIQLDWLSKTPAVEVGNVQCDGTHECPSGNTCCKLSSGQWGCCPIPNAVCCSDDVHCCPESTTCDVSSGKCNRGNIQLDWLSKTPAIEVGTVQCDGTHECPSGNTCCKLSSGQWGCCPLPNAVCCSDGVHCCPDGTTCDVSSGKCNRGNTQLDWLTKTPAIEVRNVQCDATHECPSGNTCCKLSSGQWGCCPIPNAVCCSDGVHCCPESTTCDVSSGKCNRGNIQLDWLTKTPAIEVGNVQCDATHECPSGNTCCKLSSGQWGCCPLPNAVCCSDGVHCCPDGTTCDVSSGKCNRGNTQLDWLTKTPAIEVGNVQCDATHECPSGNTCCKLSSGQWGCCPIPNAVCCSDHVHCCPESTTCDVSAGKCNRGNTQLDWLTKTPAIEVGNVQCDATHECPSGNTCCKLSSGQWGCCPLPNAVCCSDGVHCCPDGTTCDVSSGKCNRGNTQLDWLTKTPAIEVGNVQCDGTHECPSGNTCCKLSSGQWGCCPIPNAVCCSDDVHCCPESTTCDVSSGKCNRGNIQLDWLSKTPAVEVGNVQCDATHECPSGNTCCKLSSGQWGCCPLPNAVCCSDGVHCCPDGTTCDVSSGKCNRGNTQLDWLTKTPAIEVRNVQCDATHECPSGNTCCKLSSGQWGCCPIPNAVCCSDGVHCCPESTTCDVSSGKCNRGNIQLDWLTKTPAIEIGNVQCDATHECPSGNTCCKLSSGQWGCCPLPNAVCCSDGVHCCPDGTTCDVSSGKCNRGNIELDWLTKTPAIEVGNVQCDATHECPSGNTCCKLSSGLWGCCPIPNAVCCSDDVHCCPESTTCDVSARKCNRGNTQLDWLTKTPTIEVGTVQCDATHECPSGNTCCKLSSGQWGCCPIPNAVCCSDGVHCCPDGTTCDVSSGKCNRGNTQLDWLTKTPAIEVGNVQCDATHECPSGNTCCKLSSGQWGCCPIPNAVCCSDGVHCCPESTTCDVSSGKCNRGNIQLDWLTKTPAIEVGNVQCDATHECPSGNTCCKLSSGQWGCCPLPNAVCCSDGVHCCPDGTTCDVSSGKCNRGNIQLDWLTKTPAIEVGNVQCDATHECPSGNTCCKLSSGQWGCCPIPNAVCCSDGVHCCPESTTCDVSSGKCNRGNIQLDWLTKTPAIEVGNVQCDATHECPSGNTCCKLSSGQWGCCPLPNAVCCSDGVHCCPDGTTCDVSSGKCNRGNIQLDWLTKTPAIEVGNVQCDATHECPSGNTCCKLSSGQWGCCPIPNAVCCSDHVHCCPESTTCDVSAGKCNRGNTQLDWLTKTPAIEVGNVQCDATHECPSGNTCCKLSSGQWGCCPIPNAVCCSDGVHCCPESTTCDVSSGKCNHGNIQLDWLTKTPAIEVGNVQCDATHECPSGNTCCKLSSGQWGCCPLPNAVCCSDGVHCCPGGTTCDVSSGKCNRGNTQLDWLVKVVSIMKMGDVVCPDGSECQDGQTCCEMEKDDTSYGCCPLPNAVCCSDGEHCCPQGYRCNLASGTCIGGMLKFPLIPTHKHHKPDVQGLPVEAEMMGLKSSLIIDAGMIEEKKITGTLCPDGKICPDQNSCCDNGKGSYNCCPMPSGTCCDDHQHCCPNGYICDPLPGICRIPETNVAASNFLRRLTMLKAVKHS